MSERDHLSPERLGDLIDRRLDGDALRAAQRHLEACGACRALLDAMRGAREVVRRDPGSTPPPGLATRIRASLDEIDAGRPRATAWPRWVAYLPAVLALVVLAVWLPGRFATGPTVGERMLAHAAEDFEEIRSGRLVLPLPDADPPALERFFRASELEFETHVYDLAMMDFRPAGGVVRRLVDRDSALFAYRDANGVWVVCRMFLGRLTELPEPPRILEHDGIAFHVYERDGRTLVFWQEGDVVCGLVSDAPATRVIDLSIAKAIKVPES